MCSYFQFWAWFDFFLSILQGNMSQFYQGDINLDPELEEYVKTGGNSRNAIREKKRVWSSRVIPYRIPSWMSMYLVWLYSLRFSQYNARVHSWLIHGYVASNKQTISRQTCVSGQRLLKRAAFLTSEGNSTLFPLSHVIRP